MKTPDHGPRGAADVKLVQNSPVVRFTVGGEECTGVVETVWKASDGTWMCHVIGEKIGGEKNQDATYLGADIPVADVPALREAVPELFASNVPWKTIGAVTAALVVALAAYVGVMRNAGGGDKAKDNGKLVQPETKEKALAERLRSAMHSANTALVDSYPAGEWKRFSRSADEIRRASLDRDYALGILRSYERSLSLRIEFWEKEVPVLGAKAKAGDEGARRSLEFIQHDWPRPYLALDEVCQFIAELEGEPKPTPSTERAKKLDDAISAWLRR